VCRDDVPLLLFGGSLTGMNEDGIIPGDVQELLQLLYLFVWGMVEQTMAVIGMVRFYTLKVFAQLLRAGDRLRGRLKSRSDVLRGRIGDFRSLQTSCHVG
jgi:hypothetical protein